MLLVASYRISQDRDAKKKKKKEIYHPQKNRTTIELIFWWFNDIIKETSSFQHFAFDIGMWALSTCPHVGYETNPVCCRIICCGIICRRAKRQMSVCLD